MLLPLLCLPVADLICFSALSQSADPAEGISYLTIYPIKLTYWNFTHGYMDKDAESAGFIEIYTDIGERKELL